MDYREILREMDIEMLWMPKEYVEKGTYLPPCPEFPQGAVAVRVNLLECETEFVILHEIGHLLEGAILSRLSPPQLHIVNEAKANRFAIKNKLSEWLDQLDGQYEYATAERFCSTYHLSFNDYGIIAEQEIRHAIQLRT